MLDATIQEKGSYLASIQKALEGKELTTTAADNLIRWLTHEDYQEFHNELHSMMRKEEFERLNDCFYTIIPFGTSGRRGPVGVGTNRINTRTIGESAQAVANYLIREAKNKRVKAVIAYDTRHYSREFAIRTAEVLAGNGIHTYVFKDFRSTPELSFAVRELKADVGIVISASHNPPTDNGFKVYWADGGQILPSHSQEIINEVNQIQNIKRISCDDAQSQGLVHWIGNEIDEKYWSAVYKEALLPKVKENVHIIYTPLHGTGTTSVLPILRRLGYQVDILKKQESPDGDFPEVENHIPNPEDPAVLKSAIEKAREVGADVVLATDPDADRLGVAVPLSKDKKEWVTLTGNQIASLLTYFVLEQLRQTNTLPQDGMVVKTLVTTDLMADICDSFNISIVKNLMVGFKYIAEIINRGPDRFIAGAEESNGFLKGSYTRDKDGAVAALLMAELTGYLKSQVKTPYQLLDELYIKHGYYKDIIQSILLEGAEGKRQIDQIMKDLRTSPPGEIGGLRVVEIHDYQSGTVRDSSLRELRRLEGTDDLLVFTLSQDDRMRVAVRPSGTEPKIKYYVSVHSKVKDTAEENLARTKELTNALAAAIARDIVQRSEVVL